VTTETDWLWGAEFLYSESEGFHIVAVVYAGSGVRRPEQRADADLRERQGGAAAGTQFLKIDLQTHPIFRNSSIKIDL
jgi:hypothetical protein